jgi:hypothetical protein
MPQNLRLIEFSLKSRIKTFYLVLVQIYLIYEKLTINSLKKWR